MSKYCVGIIEKAINMTFEMRQGVYYTSPTTEKDIVYKHKITFNAVDMPLCGCKWAQINLKKPDKKLCSHALGVLYLKNKSKFWEEVSK